MPRKFQGFDLSAASIEAAERRSVDITFAELCDAYDGARPSDANSRLKKWVAVYGLLSAWAIERDALVTSGQAMLRAGYSPSSVNRDLSAIGTVYKWAEERQLAPRNFVSPTLSIRRHTEPMRVIHLTLVEHDRMRKCAFAFQDRRFALLVLLLLDSGARIGELLERRWDEFDTKRCEVVLDPEDVKTRVARVLHFSAETAALIERLRPGKAQRAGLAFESRRKRGTITKFRDEWAELFRMIGRPDLQPRDTRHICAAAMLDEGATLAVTAQSLGHSSLILHKRYGHLERDAIKRAKADVWRRRAARLGETSAGNDQRIDPESSNVFVLPAA